VKTDVFPEAELVRWEKFRREDDFGILVQATGEVHREAAGAGGHSRRAGRSIAATISGRSNYLLNELGIALIYPNVRGSTGYGKTFSLLDNGFKSAKTPTRTLTRCSIGSRRSRDWIASGSR